MTERRATPETVWPLSVELSLWLIHDASGKGFSVYD